MVNIRAIFIILYFFTQITSSNAESTHTFYEDTLEIITKKNNYLFNIEIADNNILRSYGLMRRKKLEDKKGMLFIYPNSRKVTMWMKNTLISLDMLFIKKNGRIVKIKHNAIPLNKSLINSEEKVLGVLEINAGVAKLLNIKVGDRINYKLFK